MPTISYPFTFPYTYSTSGEPFPILPLSIGTLDARSPSFHVDGYIDTGAQRTVFDGVIAAAIGLELLQGHLITLRSATGFTIDARVHSVVLAHPQLGEFVIEAGFTTVPITRNLIGRDFLAHIQIGFQERHLTYYMSRNT